MSKLIPLISDANLRITRSRYKCVGKMKQFVLREYLVKHNTINLVNGFRNRLEMISSGIPL